MPKGAIFWLLMILWVVLGGMWYSGRGGPYGPWGFGLLGFALFFLLGWQVFGFVIR